MPDPYVGQYDPGHLPSPFGTGIFFCPGRPYATERMDAREWRYVRDVRYVAGTWTYRSGDCTDRKLLLRCYIIIIYIHVGVRLLHFCFSFIKGIQADILCEK